MPDFNVGGEATEAKKREILSRPSRFEPDFLWPISTYVLFRPSD
jgi:hypothetical protein